MLTEEQVRAHLVGIQVLHQWLGILRETCCENYQLVDLVHILKELSDKGSNKNIDSADLTINFNGEHNVCIVHGLER